MVQQTQVKWTVPGAGGGTTILHFGDDALSSDISAKVGAFMAAARPVVASAVAVSSNGLVRVLNTATGVLEDEFTITPTGGGSGSGGSGLVPNAAQGLIRFRTGAVVNGRFLAGRIYVPGLPSSAMNNSGEVAPSGLSGLVAIGTALVGNPAPLHIWHRPTALSGGSSAPVSGVSAWGEFAVQRRRRS